jgi:potassium efflux system protein
MKRTTTITAAVVTVSVWASLAAAQSATADDPTLEELRTLQAAAERDAGLNEELQTRIIDLYDQAIASLEDADGHRSAAAAFERDRARVDQLIADLKAELDQPAPTPELTLGDAPTVEEAEDAVARERSRLAANMAALREEQQVADERMTTRSDISRRLGELDLELELLNRELRAQTDSTDRSELKLAVRMRVLAQREAATTEIGMLRARLALLADRSALIPLNIDLANRRVAASRELVEIHIKRARELRAEVARSSRRHVEETCRTLSEELPQIADIAAETTALAEMLWGPDGVVTQAEQTVSELDETRAFQAELNHIAQLTARKFEVYGHRGSVTRWWPEIPEDFPEIAAIAKTIRYLDEEIPEVDHHIITSEQDRARAHELSRNTIEQLKTELGDEFTPELEQRVRQLFELRQDLLDELIQKGGRYSNQLTEYRTVLGNFFTQVTSIEAFLYSHVLWSRSVPRPIIPRPVDVLAAARWVTSPTHFEDLSFEPELRTRALLAIAVLLFLIVVRRPMRRRLVEIAKRVGTPGRDRIGLTIEALLISGVLAAPMPLLLFFVGVAINRYGASGYWFASARAFIELASVTALLESIRQVFMPKGLAEVHFGWPVAATRPLQRGLLSAELLGLPPLYLALHLAFAGMRFNSSAELQLYNNSLGRLAFIIGLGILGALILTMLRPERKAEPAATDMRVPWPARFSEYAFPAAFLGAYPIIIIATIVPALLAALGYYITGLLLAYQMLRTLLLAFAILVVGGLIHRWRMIQQRRLLLEAENESEQQATIREIEAGNRQVRYLSRFALVAVLAVGLVSIWSDALPMLQILKRVQLLPTIALVETEDSLADALGISTELVSPEPAAGDDAQSPTDGTVPVDPTGVIASTESAPSSDSRPLTLWTLFEAIIAGLVTFVLVRNLPGIIELVLKRRTTLDGGARFALSTLVRYTISIFGAIIVFSLLGIGWSKVQWLAAALTFGLGFGLQEIVANFVSGLILLIERPVRVGDVVTIGNLMGRVSRIQIRATTITLWDRSEMIVPNKEFITTKLVNWTLSDSKRRIEIPLRVAYGADLEQVKSLLVGCAESHPLVLDDPAPHALLIAFGDDAINFELRFVVDFGNGIQAKDDVQMAIDRSFKEHGIEFALPQLRLQLPEADSKRDHRPPISEDE